MKTGEKERGKGHLCILIWAMGNDLRPHSGIILLLPPSLSLFFLFTSDFFSSSRLLFIFPFSFISTYISFSSSSTLTHHLPPSLVIPPTAPWFYTLSLFSSRQEWQINMQEQTKSSATSDVSFYKLLLSLANDSFPEILKQE